MDKWGSMVIAGNSDSGLAGLDSLVRIQAGTSIDFLRTTAADSEMVIPSGRFNDLFYRCGLFRFEYSPNSAGTPQWIPTALEAVMDGKAYLFAPVDQSTVVYVRKQRADTHETEDRPYDNLLRDPRAIVQ